MSLYDSVAPVYEPVVGAHVGGRRHLRRARAPNGETDRRLAVGNGRVAIPVAQAVGRAVIGVDSSPAMLAQGRDRAAAANVTLDLRLGDMRELTLAEPAD